VLRLPAVVTQHEDRPDTRNQLSSKPRADFLNSPQRAGNPCTLANSSIIERTHSRQKSDRQLKEYVTF
jgi:hypothetical protein